MALTLSVISLLTMAAVVGMSASTMAKNPAAIRGSKMLQSASLPPACDCGAKSLFNLPLKKCHNVELF
jgi:hypothetical protein